MRQKTRTPKTASATRITPARMGWIGTGMVVAAALFGMGNEALADRIEREGRPPLEGVELVEFDATANKIRFTVPGVDGIQTISGEGLKRIVIDREETGAATPPKPKPEGGAATTPTPKKPTATKLNTEVDEMLGPEPNKKFFDNVDGALKKLTDGLKADKEVAKDPQFWLRLGMLYGSTGQKKPGDWPESKEHQEQKLLALGCFNHAYGLDPSVNDTYYPPARATLAQAFAGLANQVGRRTGLSRAEAAKLDVEVERDGTLKLIRKR